MSQCCSLDLRFMGSKQVHCMRAEWCNQSVAVQLEGTARLPRLLAGLGTGGVVVVVLPLKYFTTVYLVHCPNV